MTDKKLSEFSAVQSSDVSDIVVLYNDPNNAKKNGRLSFASFVSTLALLSGNNTFSGSNTFSGNVVFSGNVTFNNPLNVLCSRATADANGNQIDTTYATKTELQQKASFKLFHHDWFDYELNDQDWLKADAFSWQDGTVYTNAYNHLVDDIDGKTASTEIIDGTTVTYYLADDGHKIVKVDDVTAIETVYSSTGVAWYYVLDTANQRFKLPRENPAREELIQVVRAKGSGTTIGLNDDVTKQTYDGAIQTGRSGYSAGSANLVSVNIASGPGYPMGIIEDSTKSGIISDMTDSTSVYKGKKHLYFYVGQFSQSATEQTAGLNSELFNSKVDLDFGNMNPSATAKETINGFGMPDYTAGVSKTWGTDITAEANGCVIAHASASSSTRINAVVNGVTLPFNDLANTGRLSISFWVPKGAVWKVYGGDNSERNIVFYPCIGG